MSSHTAHPQAIDRSIVETIWRLRREYIDPRVNGNLCYLLAVVRIHMLGGISMTLWWPPLSLTGVVLHATTKFPIRIQSIDSMACLANRLECITKKTAGKCSRTANSLLSALPGDLLRCRAELFRVRCAIRRDGMALGFGSDYRALDANTRTRSLGG
jgi:hypothetical protein